MQKIPKSCKRDLNNSKETYKGHLYESLDLISQTL